MIKYENSTLKIYIRNITKFIPISIQLLTSFFLSTKQIAKTVKKLFLKTKIVYGDSSSRICGSATGSHVIGSDVSHVPSPEVCSAHAQPEVVQYPSQCGLFTGSDVSHATDRKRPCPEVCSAHARFPPRFFLCSTVVTWLPDVTFGHLTPSGFPWVCTCAT